MFKNSRKLVSFIVILVIVGQILFALVSRGYTVPRYEGRLFATTGIEFTGQDLHKLNEGAHYFGQTMIGWTRFPSFRVDLINFAGLPVDSDINMHAQERQNFIFTVNSKSPIEINQIILVKDFIQGKIDEYNENTKTEFILSNLDYQTSEINRSYSQGALFVLILSVVLGLALNFIREEFFPNRKLKFWSYCS